MKFVTEQEVYAYLDQFLNFERKLEPTEYRLDRMETLRELFDCPDESYRVVHVAGSKGKGSTATMIASVLAEVEGPVGLYTSPHLLSFTERIAIDGSPVTTAILLESAEELSDRLEGKTNDDFPGGENPTYFELLTMLSFLCFRRAGCTSAVIEVGLGGRLDSTNVVSPVACAITSIELEHTDLLGGTIPLIAREKAGIIKAGVPVYTSVLNEEALEVIRRRAQELGAPLTVLDDSVGITDCAVGMDGTRARLHCLEKSCGSLPSRLFTPMIGDVQVRNAALAALITSGLGVGTDAIVRGLAKARLRARFEIMQGDPVIILDGAHTADSVAACASDFYRLFPGGGILLFGCAKGKSPRAMAAALRPSFGSVIITKPGTFKESDPAEIQEAFKAEGYATRRNDATEEAIAMAIADARSTNLPLLVTGSFYLCAAVAAYLAAK
ncbi:MAG: bifunctional folylpolyglutamate synthase/dihydrofolate synthase [Spirochaetales bacterium]|nr:bifunctional folylpolyglutamate synthase/dihydrofolate synthase [Spirochaetales bacterium]